MFSTASRVRKRIVIAMSFVIATVALTIINHLFTVFAYFPISVVYMCIIITLNYTTSTSLSYR